MLFLTSSPSMISWNRSGSGMARRSATVAGRRFTPAEDMRASVRQARAAVESANGPHRPAAPRKTLPGGFLSGGPGDTVGP